MQELSISPLPTPSYDREDWKRGYQSQPEETDYWIDEVTGTIPPDLTGTIFRNGPGLTDVAGTPLAHPFDGDGMICRFTFKGGRAHFSNRYVRTEGYLAEQAAGRILYRGVFGTQKPGGVFANAFDLRIKNIANTHVLPWGGKLLALWEAAEPHGLDPATLETLGLDRLDGVLKPGDAFAAHPRIDPMGAAGRWGENGAGQRRLVNFAVKPGLSTTITIYEFDEAGALRSRHSHSVPGFAFLHDFALTPNYCIFFQNPVTFNPLPYVLGFRSAAQCIQFDAKQPTRAIVIPRNPEAGPVKVLETQPCFVFHHANAHEADGQIIVDSVCYESFPSVDPDTDFREIEFDSLPAGQLWRYSLDLAAGTVHSRLMEARSCEFPTLHPNAVGRSQRYLYIGAAHDPKGNGPLQGILKLDLETGARSLWSAAPRGFMSEPLFVPRPGGTAEDDGWVIVTVYNAANHRSEVAILEAWNWAAGPVATLHLRQHVPYGLHGSYTPTCFIED